MGLLKRYRIYNWWYFLGLPILGSLVTGNYPDIKDIVISALLLAFAYSWNDYFDYKKYQNGSILIPLLPLCVAIFLTFTLGQNKLFATCLFLIIAGSYSMPPFRLKKYPFISTLCNTIGFSLLFLIGTTKITMKIVPSYFYLLFLLTIAQLLHELAHLPEDENQNIITTAIFIKEEKTNLLILAFFILAIIVSLFISPLIFMTSLIIGLNQRRIFRKEKNYQYLRKIFRWQGLILGAVLAFYFFYANLF